MYPSGKIEKETSKGITSKQLKSQELQKEKCKNMYQENK